MSLKNEFLNYNDNINFGEKSSFSAINDISFLKTIINAFSSYILILDKNREVVFSNHNFTAFMSIVMGKEIGQRIGDVFNCIHIKDSVKGCGTSEYCNLCGANNTILNCQKENDTVFGECRITAKKEGKIIAYDFLVSASPIKFQHEDFTFVSIQDIGESKRKSTLEKIFFSSVVNIISELNSLITYYKIRKSSSNAPEMLNDIGVLCQKLLDEISEQRDLLEAESGKLPVIPEIINSFVLMELSVNSINMNSYGQKIRVQISKDSDNFNFKSDYKILSHLLKNMLKNAYEFGNENGIVTIGCKEDKSRVLFWVNNNFFMEKDVQLQVFQRNFSTKGKHRGLGTYSLKLLGENILNGNVGFFSNKITGTTFQIEIPNFL